MLLSVFIRKDKNLRVLLAIEPNRKCLGKWGEEYGCVLK